jgi:hypothetical protein
VVFSGASGPAVIPLIVIVGKGYGIGLVFSGRQAVRLVWYPGYPRHGLMPFPLPE